jgi:hypothetical protein
MPTPPLSRELMQEALLAVQEHGTMSAAARSIGIPVGTFTNRFTRAKGEFGYEKVQKPFHVDPLPDEDLSTLDLLTHRKRQFAKRTEAREAKRIIPIKIGIDGPIGIAHFGDPHIDDDGTNIVALERHVQIVNQTEGLFAGNAGDTTNNWPGRLARLYGEQSTSAKQAWQLAEWLFTSMHWLYAVGGNHDCFSGAGDPLKWIARQANVMYQAHGLRMELQFPNGKRVRVNARHDFRGSSIYNTAHGVMKAAKFGWRDHILTCGHTHVSGYGLEKCPSTRLVSHCLRIASYKTYDKYADAEGFMDQNVFVCPVTIIDPQYEDHDPRLITTIFDPEEAAGYLTWKRQRAGASGVPRGKARRA